MVEIGGYIGYSAIRFYNIAKNDVTAHYYSVELSPIMSAIMEKVYIYVLILVD